MFHLPISLSKIIKGLVNRFLDQTYFIVANKPTTYLYGLSFRGISHQVHSMYSMDKRLERKEEAQR